MASRMRLALSVTLLTFIVGCAANPIVGHGVTETGRFRGDVGISGNGTKLTILAGSDVPKLSIVGDACVVDVEEGARIERIEFWGAASTVSLPADLSPIVASVGSNKVIHRPAGQPPTTQPGATSKPANP